MTATRHAKPNAHHIKKHHFWAAKGGSTATHTTHLNQPANTALKAIYAEAAQHDFHQSCAWT